MDILRYWLHTASKSKAVLHVTHLEVSFLKLNVWESETKFTEGEGRVEINEPPIVYSLIGCEILQVDIPLTHSQSLEWTLTWSTAFVTE